MRITSAREQFELLSAWSEEALRTAAGRSQFPAIPSKGLDALGISQRKLNGNFNSWMDTLSDQDKAEGGLWYPTGNDWGHHQAQEHGRHPDKMFGVMSKMSPQRDWYGNLDDAQMMAQHHGRNPGGISKPAGISGTDNLRQSMRVMDAPDDPDSINAAFLGTKNVGGRPVARTPRDLPKTHDFYTALRDPEAGGAGNHAAQPAVADSWMSRSMLWSKDKWDQAQAGGKPLTWPGQGTGEGLDKHLPVKKPNPETGKWEVVGSKPPTARDVAARVTGMGGGYDRMRQAMQQGAARHDMPFAHGAQAAVWKQISGNKNPNDPEFDHSKVGPHGTQWNQMWNQRASGLHVPQQQGLIARVAAHGSAFDPHGPEDSLDEGWGGPEDISAIMRHVSMAPQGWDHWEDRPGLINLGPAGRDPRQDPRLSRYDREVLAFADGVLAGIDLGPEFQKSVMKDVDETGGFSRRGPQKAPDKGFMVAQPGAEKIEPSPGFSGQSIADYGQQHSPAMEADPDLYQGGWNDEESGDFYHDLSKHHDDIWDAAKAGYGDNEEDAQHGIYDLGTGTTFSPLELHNKWGPGYMMAGRED